MEFNLSLSVAVKASSSILRKIKHKMKQENFAYFLVCTRIVKNGLYRDSNEQVNKIWRCIALILIP